MLLAIPHKKLFQVLGVIAACHHDDVYILDGEEQMRLSPEKENRVELWAYVRRPAQTVQGTARTPNQAANEVARCESRNSKFGHFSDLRQRRGI